MAIPQCPTRKDVGEIETMIYQVNDDFYVVPFRFFYAHCNVFREPTHAFELDADVDDGLPGRSTLCEDSSVECDCGQRGSSEEPPRAFELVADNRQSDDYLDGIPRIELPVGTTRVEFELLLKVVAPLAAPNPASMPTLTLSEWLSVLTLATAWDISSIRSLALAQIKDLYCEHSATLRQQRKVAISDCDDAKLLYVQQWVRGIQQLYFEGNEFMVDAGEGYGEFHIDSA
ncbi:hypothetical protein BDP27DRAFT_1485401 [Rhodocollybia butyracea]|uniref:Uncharacterized protein n=1 Tax=Rhodocollybia butyracea TaxID=206335 RepID=A0A9P5U0V4_9AGAR|nr:hypothetical protein BDP27DRAFT_1485401 [Rhodocollybia butyracea]